MNFVIAGGIAAVGYYNQDEIISKIKNLGFSSYMKATEWYVQLKEQFSYMYTNDYYIDTCKKIILDDNFKIIENNNLSIHYNDTFQQIIDKFNSDNQEVETKKTILIFKYYLRLKHINKEYYFIYDTQEKNELPDITLENIYQFAKSSSLSKKILSISYFDSENDDENDITEMITKYLGPYNNFYNFKNLDFRYLYDFQNDRPLFHEDYNSVNIIFCNMNIRNSTLEEIGYKCMSLI